MRKASYRRPVRRSADAVSRARTRTLRLLLPLRPIRRASSQVLPCPGFELARILQNQFEKRTPLISAESYMMRQVSFHRPSIGPEEEREVLDTLRSGWITTGPKAKRFETEFAEYVGAKHAVALSHCTGALQLALWALGIGPADGVITTPFTFTATAEILRYLGARPVFVDVDPGT